MKNFKDRDDLSRFLVHLTRDYEGDSAYRNLLNILSEKTIEARNAHCLVMHNLKSMRFSQVLKRRFNTVCFTETPLTQIKKLISVGDRKIELQPWGIIFWKDDLFESGASPAIYINAKGTSVDKFLLDEFAAIFENITTLSKLKETEVQHYHNIVHYYSLINVVKESHDFMWEREWRHHGDFKFKYEDIVAIIAKNPDRFENLCEKKLPQKAFEKINKLPIISTDWGYEELVEKLTIKIWNKLTK